jgi:hypothetical protein
MLNVAQEEQTLLVSVQNFDPSLYTPVKRTVQFTIPGCYVTGTVTFTL